MASREKNHVIVCYVIDQQHSIAEAAARFGVSRRRVHVLTQRYLADGPAGIAPRSACAWQRRSRATVTSPTGRNLRGRTVGHAQP
ncbi:MAG: helix-turn-helix domain-containing protein [Austwickia sp.]|nr:helix-turn-helix domain-containing protein [Austwickia sp.]MBK8436211.1 helix-turn-helix domain-containing protein [Austwickia sp.]MBK9101892.1 helix-turn-helix domain-containing protein [Austwickia sp.]